MTSPIFRTPALPLPNAADLEIYGLAVDSTAFPGDSRVLLLQGSTLWVAPTVLEQHFDARELVGTLVVAIVR